MWVIDSPRAKRTLWTGWAVFATVNAALMYILPGEETIPYHLVWASFAFLYGLSRLRPVPTWTLFGLITVVTGIPLIRHAISGIVGWEECSEIVLMGVIGGLLVWHVNRYEDERETLGKLRENERAKAANRELTTRFGSHEMRTRLAIVRGLVDLIRSGSPEARVRADATLALREVDKATTLADSLMTLLRADDTAEPDEVDLDELLDSLVRRWTARADRDWVATPLVCITVPGNAERIEAAVDCLLENAVKFTGPGDRIAVDARFERRDVVIEVRDSGAGIPPEDLDHVTELFRTGSSAGERAGHGLGLAIVRGAVEARGGTLDITSQLGVGTCVTMRVPHGRARYVEIVRPEATVVRVPSEAC